MRKTILLAAIASSWFLTSCRGSGVSARSVAIEQASLAQFTDDFFPLRMETLGIPGLCFVLMEDGAVVLSMGYGVADIASGERVDPDSTLMRIGSVSKPFVAVAVMQLAEAGRLSLDVDINRYLKSMQVQSDFTTPVTLAHLLTHTGGFDGPPYVSNTDPASVEPLAQFLADSMPPVTSMPGTLFTYSNYGYALAALVVEEVSGQPFDQYVLDHILRPLQMSDTSYLLTPPVPENIATGYKLAAGAQEPQPIDYDGDYPGGSIVSTAGDMSHFLVALANGGCYEGACILRALSVAEMFEPRAETPYEGQRVTYGFVQGTSGGQLLLGHSGAIRGFGSFLGILLDQEIGYFLSFNEECYETSACDIIPEFRTAFADWYLD
jgi:CubicO group peptidase (beta-lactamase class C family)